MYLQAKHKEFAVRSYAKFMTRKQVAQAFIKEFPHDLPKPEPKPKKPERNDQSTQEIEQEKAQFISLKSLQKQAEYDITYGNQAQEKFKEHMPQIQKGIEEEYAQWIQNRQPDYEEKLQDYQQQLAKYEKEVQRIVSNRLRRYNITNTEFPKKYINLFNQTRLEFLTTAFHSQETKATDNATTELELLYGYLKQNIFQTLNAKKTAPYIGHAITILKAIMQNNKQPNEP